MELRLFADRILDSPEIDRKLVPAETPLTDCDPGPPVRTAVPARPDRLRFCGRKQAPAMPHPESFPDPARRAIAHHIMANHELQALEVMAFVLRAFPLAPSEFRLGVARVMADEQRHTRMHIDRAAELGLQFGDLPVNGYFWAKAQEYQSILEYLAGLPLTFEGGNLDHTLEFEHWFEQAGDRKSAGVMRAVHRDEIEHVAFGWEWLKRLKPPELTEWQAYERHLHWPIRPAKARGKTFHRPPREAAGLSPEFIDKLAESTGPLEDVER